MDEIEENLITNYTNEAYLDLDYQKKVLEESRQIEQIPNGVVIHTYYDGRYNLIKKEEAKYEKRQTFDSSNNLISSEVIDLTKKEDMQASINRK